jgi:23S rRNA (uracil1939-C5)-methyltransferase
MSANGPNGETRESGIGGAAGLAMRQGRRKVPGADRPPADGTLPRCAVFGVCGGCLLQDVSYPAQWAWKVERVRRELARVGVPAARVAEGWPASNPYAYRNKMEFTFGTDGLPGLHRRGGFGSVVPLTTCPIALPQINRALSAVYAWAAAEKLPGYDKRTGEGFLRHVMVRASEGRGEWLVLLTTTSPERLDGGTSRWEAALRRLIDRLATEPGFVSLAWTLDESPGDALHGLDRPVLRYGSAAIEETLGGFRFRIEPATFFQTNTPQAERLVQRVLALAAPNPGDRVLDLYAGTGTFTLPLARAVGPSGDVLGVDYVEAAVRAGFANATANGLAHTRWIAGTVRAVLAELAKGRSWPVTCGEPLPVAWQPDLVVLDPPRAGAGPKVMGRMARLAPRRIVYVSCNPAALATDLAFLAPYGYRLTTAEPLDLFPQTPHVETVALLEPARP